MIGAGSGIGKEVAHRLVKEGAHIVCVDLNKEAAEATAKEITDKYGAGIGVAGSGISGCGPAIGLSANMTDRASIRAALDQVALAYGGFDSIESHRRHFRPSDTTGHIPDDKWALTFGDQRHRQLPRRPTKPPRPGRNRASRATSSSPPAPMPPSPRRAAWPTTPARPRRTTSCANSPSNSRPLVRVQRRRAGHRRARQRHVPRDRVIGSLAKYNIPYTEDEATESLVNKLAQFYADRTLTKAPITPADQAEASLPPRHPAAEQDHRGQVITVDGGLHEAFLR